MALSNTLHPLMREHAGSFELAAGKSVKFETTPNGEELINETVPEGKKWTISVGIKITEEDA